MASKDVLTWGRFWPGSPSEAGTRRSGGERGAGDRRVVATLAERGGARRGGGGGGGGDRRVVAALARARRGLDAAVESGAVSDRTYSKPHFPSVDQAEPTRSATASTATLRSVRRAVKVDASREGDKYDYFLSRRGSVAAVARRP